MSQQWDKALHPYSTCSPRRTGAGPWDAARAGEPVFVAIAACHQRKRVSGASHPPRLQIVAYGRLIVRDQRVKAEQPLIAPLRPMATGGMGYAQRMDLQAAIADKITWAEYNRKWGGRSLSL